MMFCMSHYPTTYSRSLRGDHAGSAAPLFLGAVPDPLGTGRIGIYLIVVGGAEKDITFWIGPPGYRAVGVALDVQCNSDTGLANCCSALGVAQVNALKLLKKALSSPANLRFEEVYALARAFGFHFSRVNGSHHIFARAGVAELLNLQEIDGKAKPGKAVARPRRTV
jgi:hypothetical protein